MARAGSRSGALRWQYRHCYAAFSIFLPSGPGACSRTQVVTGLPSGLLQHFTVWTGSAVVCCVHRFTSTSRPHVHGAAATCTWARSSTPRVPLQHRGAPTASARCASTRPHARRPPPLSSPLGTARVPLGYPERHGAAFRPPGAQFSWYGAWCGLTAGAGGRWLGGRRRALSRCGARVGFISFATLQPDRYYTKLPI